MTSMMEEPVILKTDGVGRVRTPVAQREAMLDAFERSGLSGMKFAALHGVKYPGFANWVQQRKRRRLSADGGPGAGAGARPENSGSGSGSGFGSGSSLQWWEGVVSEAGPLTDGTGAGSVVSGLRLHLPGGVRMEITAGEQVGWAARLLQALAPGVAPRASNLQPLRSC